MLLNSYFALVPSSLNLSENELDLVNINRLSVYNQIFEFHRYCQLTEFDNLLLRKQTSPKRGGFTSPR